MYVLCYSTATVVTINTTITGHIVPSVKSVTIFEEVIDYLFVVSEIHSALFCTVKSDTSKSRTKFWRRKYEMLAPEKRLISERRRGRHFANSELKSTMPQLQRSRLK